MHKKFITLIIILTESKAANSLQPKKPLELHELFGGDMVGVRFPQGGELRKAATQRNILWPNGIVYYKIDQSLFSYRNVIRSAMNQIESKTCVRFRERRNRNDYVYFVNGDGCYSSVGRVGGRQHLSLGDGCHDIGSTLHEILHSLGFYHEHMRSDRDKFIRINWENIQKGMKDQFAKVPEDKNRLLTKFDFNSIMIYGSKAFSKNGRNTMTPKVKGATMVESHYKRSLSLNDVISINKLYECNQRRL